MRNVQLSVPTLATIGATRGLLGAGLGLLIANKLGRSRRRRIGYALAAIGALTTIPIGISVFRSLRA